MAPSTSLLISEAARKGQLFAQLSTSNSSRQANMWTDERKTSMCVRAAAWKLVVQDADEVANLVDAPESLSEELMDKVMLCLVALDVVTIISTLTITFQVVLFLGGMPIEYHGPWWSTQEDQAVQLEEAPFECPPLDGSAQLDDVLPEARCIATPLHNIP
eukprot:5099406-Amphidinium_carterae.1